MGGLLPWIKAEVEFCRSVGLSQMMKYAQMVGNREIMRREANLLCYSGTKFPNYPYTNAKINTVLNSQENKGNTIFPMRTITLRGSPAGEIKKAHPSDYLMLSFRPRERKDFVSNVMKSITQRINAKQRKYTSYECL